MLRWHKVCHLGVCLIRRHFELLATVPKSLQRAQESHLHVEFWATTLQEGNPTSRKPSGPSSGPSSFTVGWANQVQARLQQTQAMAGMRGR